MKIYSMTATFGKLENQTLTLQPGLNVIHAPNEWGKSTWCAFLLNMLYGIDTKERTKQDSIADKDRYAPWSGAPMSGKIDLCWNGRDITIERSSNQRVPMGLFRAYETETGIDVPELNAANCGQVLLGVERNVFIRAGFLKLSDLPVTQDEALRRRLNALVTTGDDSGTGDDLERKLRELKNRCRYNRTGLLPQAEAEAAEVDRKLRELDGLETQSSSLRRHCSDLEDQISKLENHRTALRYEAAQNNAQKLETAEQQLLQAEQTLRNQEDRCRKLPPRKTLEDSLKQLQDLQHRWTHLQMASDHPETPLEHPIFRGMSPEDARKKVAADTVRHKALTGWKPLLLVAAILTILAGCCTTILSPEHRHYGLAGLIVGIVIFSCWLIALLSGRSKAGKLAASYGINDPDKWTSMMQDYVNYITEAKHTQLQRQVEINTLQKQILALCQNRSPSDAMRYWQDALDHWEALEDAEKTFCQQKERRDLLGSLTVAAPAPQNPDELNWSEEETADLVVETARKLRETQHRLGQCQGQMEAIGYRTALEAQRNALNCRIRQLEDTYAALTLSLDTLEKARAALQRRFAPRITSRAKELLVRLTEGRYDRLVLGNDLTLHATAADEDTQRTTLWRSDGTADLLYLALRLAVAEALTPEAPLILDDALVRFDDLRLERAMAVLKEEAVHRQIILFTCHSRESQYV